MHTAARQPNSVNTTARTRQEAEASAAATLWQQQIPPTALMAMALIAELCFQVLKMASVNFDGAVDLVNEDKRGAETNSACHEGKRIGDHKHVAKIQQNAYMVANLRPCAIVEARIHEDIKRRRCAGKERAPMPIVVLIAQLEVRECD